MAVGAYYKDRVRDEHVTSGVFELSVEEMTALRQVYDEAHRIFCTTHDTTFEEFCGDMIELGVAAVHEKYKEFLVAQGIIEKK